MAALLMSVPAVYVQGKIALLLMGDSTIADKELSYVNPERGWGIRG